MLDSRLLDSDIQHTISIFKVFQIILFFQYLHSLGLYNFDFLLAELISTKSNKR
jgi:hypothetical protein